MRLALYGKCVAIAFHIESLSVCTYELDCLATTLDLAGVVFWTIIKINGFN